MLGLLFENDELILGDSSSDISNLSNNLKLCIENRKCLSKNLETTTWSREHLNGVDEQQWLTRLMM